MLRFHVTGDWREGAVRSHWTGSGRRTRTDIDDSIERSWLAAKQRLGDRLFDGPMCRLESWNASPPQLNLTLSPTSYRIFLGTNLIRPHELDAEFLANPVGVSTVLLTRDDFLMLGVRNDRVAYYPNRVHPFAGSLEPDDVDAASIFNCVRRELDEELSLRPDEITDARCVGLVEDLSLRQPELIFSVRTTRSRQQVEASVHAAEHHDSLAIAADRASLEQELAKATPFTPVGIASLLLCGRGAFGEDWFRTASAPFARGHSQ
jgi:8-oxo-dGTP pyrophosphatase MutT (NUDIX family)